ncbi:MAG: hypothetical protein OEV44_01340 [Spirochaetota bacterium]|nr:hypothetical protein [Spirochaetota bacterium]
MAIDEGTIYADVRIRLDALSGDIKEVNTKLDQIGKKAEDTGKKGTSGLGKFFSFIKSSGVGSFLALGTAIAGVTKFLSDSEKAATNAQETFSKFDTVFEAVGSTAQETADRFASTFDVADVTAKKLLSTTGDLITGFGATDAQALDLSERVNILAADLASFSNIEGGVERASQALTAALLGEREQAKQLGIVIREADIQQRLLEKGQSKLTGQALLLAKAEATLELSYEQSKKAIGDYERTQDSAANASKRAKESTLQLQVALGGVISEALTPLRNIWAQVAGAIAEAITQEREFADLQKRRREGNTTLQEQIDLLKQNLEFNQNIINAQKGYSEQDKARAAARIANINKEIKAIEDQQNAETKRVETAKKTAAKEQEIAKQKEEIINRRTELDSLLADRERENLIESTVLNEDAKGALKKLYDQKVISVQEYISALDAVDEAEKTLAEENKKRLEEEAQLRQQLIQTTLTTAQSLFSSLIALSQANLQEQLYEIDQETQARLKAAGLQEETQKEKLQKQLEEAISAGDLETQNDLENEIKRITIIEEGDKKKAQLSYEAALLQWNLSKANAVASAAQAILTTASSVPWPFNVPLTIAQGVINGINLAAINKSKPKPPAFEDGGIVLGNSFSGDKVDAKVNSGEMILNREQQTRLFNMIGSGSGGGSFTLIIERDSKQEAQRTVDYINNGLIRLKI